MLDAKEELSIPKALVEPESYNIQDKMQYLLTLLDRSGGRLLFAEAFPTGSRSELIVTFLAMLELIKLKAVVVRQQRLFADIYICVKGEEEKDE